MTAIAGNDNYRGRDAALALLSLAAGSMDALAFLTMGDVFTSAMSGNTILFGLALGQGRLHAASHSIAAFIGYVVGVAGASLPLRRGARGIGRVLAVEAVILASFAMLWTASGAPSQAPFVYALIGLSAIAMGLQGAAARHLQVPGILTIVFTSTLTAIVAAIAERLLARTRPLLDSQARRQLTMFLVYLASAVMTGLAAPHWLAVMPFVPVAAILIVLAGLRRRWLLI